MIPRRQLVGGGLLGGVLAALDTDASAEPVAAAEEVSDVVVREIANAVNRLRTEIQEQREFTEIAQIRDQQKTFLRANGKFPDFIEVGSDIWLHVHDWHIRWQQPLTLGRDQMGRYTLQLLGTNVIMKLDASATFVGLPFDGR